VFGGGFVLLNNIRGDAPAGADRDALVFGPGPDAPAAITACRGSPWARRRPYPQALAWVIAQQTPARRWPTVQIRPSPRFSPAHRCQPLRPLRRHRLRDRQLRHASHDAQLCNPVQALPAPQGAWCREPSRDDYLTFPARQGPKYATAQATVSDLQKRSLASLAWTNSGPAE